MGIVTQVIQSESGFGLKNAFILVVDDPQRSDLECTVRSLLAQDMSGAETTILVACEREPQLPSEVRQRVDLLVLPSTDGDLDAMRSLALKKVPRDVWLFHARTGDVFARNHLELFNRACVETERPIVIGRPVSMNADSHIVQSVVPVASTVSRRQFAAISEQCIMSWAGDLIDVGGWPIAVEPSSTALVIQRLVEAGCRIIVESEVTSIRFLQETSDAAIGVREALTETESTDPGSLVELRRSLDSCLYRQCSGSLGAQQTEVVTAFEREICVLEARLAVARREIAAVESTRWWRLRDRLCAMLRR